MELYYQTFGKGKPLFILHGLFGSSDNWLSLGKQFAETYQVIIPDLRNHGDSPHSDIWDYDSMAEDVHQLAAKLGLDKIYLIGHSMGGKVAMKIAGAFPGFVEKMVVADIGPKQYPIQHRVILDGLMGINLDSIKSRKEADEQLSESVPEMGIRQFLFKNLARVSEGGFRWKLNLEVINDKIAYVGASTYPASDVSIPVLFIRGSKSPYVADSDQQDIKAHFTYAKFETINNAGHWLHAEQPQPFFDQVMAFLSKKQD